MPLDAPAETGITHIVGSVEYVDHMGDDLTAVNAARVSFDRATGWDAAGQMPEKDRRLTRYLVEHRHMLPFRHPHLSLRITAPIFVARQLGKHQVGFEWSEVSRRYVDAPPELYLPTEWRRRAPDKKQGSLDEAVEGPAGAVQATVRDAYRRALRMYDNLIKRGVAPEQARMVLPQSMMTSWIWTGSLLAFAHVCRERTAADAQAETREIAEMIAAEARARFPVCWDALMGRAPTAST